MASTSRANEPKVDENEDYLEMTCNELAEKNLMVLPLLGAIPYNEDLFRPRKIERGPMICLPTVLRLPPGQEEVVPPVREYIHQTFGFFSTKERDDWSPEVSLLKFCTPGFSENDKLMDRMNKRMGVVEAAYKEKEDPVEDKFQAMKELEALEESLRDTAHLFASLVDDNIEINQETHSSPCPVTPPSAFSSNGENDVIKNVPEDVASKDSADVLSSDSAHIVANVLADILSKVHIDDIPETPRDVMEVSSDVIPETPRDVMEVSSDVILKVPSDSALEVSADIKPEVSADIAPEVPADISSKISADVIKEAPADVIMEVSTDVI